MRKNLWILLLLLAAPLALVGCPEGDDDDSGADDDDDTATPPIIREVSPEPGEDNFFFQQDIRVEWDIAPSGVEVTLSDSAGAQIDLGTPDITSNRVFTWNPSTDLDSDADYTLSVNWNNPDAPLTVAFSTGSYGNELDTPTDLIGQAFNIELGTANFVEPPGVGGILGDLIGDVRVLFQMTPDSDFSPGAQPGLHLLGGIGEESGGNVIQDACNETLTFTYGLDGIVGTGDDTPASFVNPRLELNTDELPLSIQGVETTIQDLELTGTFNPDLSDMAGGVFAGRLDTRSLDEIVGGEGAEEGAACELLTDVVSVPCEECGGANPGVFCLSVLANELTATALPGVSITPMTCTDVIDAFEAGTCDAEDVEQYDEDGDGTYELCP